MKGRDVRTIALKSGSRLSIEQDLCHLDR